MRRDEGEEIGVIKRLGWGSVRFIWALMAGGRGGRERGRWMVQQMEHILGDVSRMYGALKK